MSNSAYLRTVDYAASLRQCGIKDEPIPLTQREADEILEYLKLSHLDKSYKIQNLHGFNVEILK
jgi:hypothetical protein